MRELFVYYDIEGIMVCICGNITAKINMIIQVPIKI